MVADCEYRSPRSYSFTTHIRKTDDMEELIRYRISEHGTLEECEWGDLYLRSTVDHALDELKAENLTAAESMENQLRELARLRTILWRVKTTIEFAIKWIETQGMPEADMCIAAVKDIRKEIRHL